MTALLLVLAAPGTPIRAYSDAMLRSYADDYGDGFFERVIANLVSEESNVRQVVTRVALGEADAGIVYQSDAIGDVSADLHIIPVDSAHNQLAAYPIAPMSSAAELPLAQRFIDFALSEAAQPIFDAYGFCTPAILGGLPDDATPEPALEADDSAENAACQLPRTKGCRRLDCWYSRSAGWASCSWRRRSPYCWRGASAREPGKGCRPRALSFRLLC